MNLSPVASASATPIRSGGPRSSTTGGSRNSPHAKRSTKRVTAPARHSHRTARIGPAPLAKQFGRRPYPRTLRQNWTIYGRGAAGQSHAKQVERRTPVCSCGHSERGFPSVVGKSESRRCVTSAPEVNLLQDDRRRIYPAIPPSSSRFFDSSSLRSAVAQNDSPSMYFYGST